MKLINIENIIAYSKLFYSHLIVDVESFAFNVEVEFVSADYMCQSAHIVGVAIM